MFVLLQLANFLAEESFLRLADKWMRHWIATAQEYLRRNRGIKVFVKTSIQIPLVSPILTNKVDEMTPMTEK